MALQGAQSATFTPISTEVKSLSNYLNPQVSSPKFSHFEVASLSDFELTILNTFLAATTRDKISLAVKSLAIEPSLSLTLNILKNPALKSKLLKFGEAIDLRINVASDDQELIQHNILSVEHEALSDDEASLLVEIIKKGEFKIVELTIQQISTEATIALLEAINQNATVQEINIKIPSYQVNQLGALRSFIAGRNAPQPDRDLDAITSRFSALMQGAQSDLREVRDTAVTYFETGKQYVSQFCSYVLGEEEVRQDRPDPATISTDPATPRNAATL